MFLLFYIVSVFLAIFVTYQDYKREGYIEVGTLTIACILTFIPILNTVFAVVMIIVNVDWGRKIGSSDGN